MNQFIHLLANSSSGLPTDIWVPSTDQIGPQLADQLSLGYSRKFAMPFTLKWSTEVFYKQMNDLIEFKNSTDFFKDGPETNFLTETNTGWEERVTIGRGWAYGLENLVQWETEKWFGWISYTLSKSDRQFEEINRGEVFPYRFDRRHDLSIFLSAPLRGRWMFSTTWILQSGHRVTLPEGSYLEKKFNLFNENDVRGVTDIIENRNNYKMPDYHRLDISFSHSKQKLKGEREWSISVYNLYARNNAFAVFLENTNPAILRPSVYQLSLFSILPSVAYRYAF